MKLLITRPEPDATATAERLIGLGYECLSLPATEIVATGNAIPSDKVTALLATSANAFRTMMRADIERLSSTPLHCAGEKTAKIAREMGFLSVHVAGGSGTKLVSDIKAHYPLHARFIYLTGSPRKPTVETELKSAGYQLTSVELYQAQAVSAWPGPMIRSLAGIDAALHFSRASVETLLVLAEQSGHIAEIKRLPHFCLSDDVAHPLREAYCPTVATAMEANEKSLLDLVAHLLP
jgi:uroporphyrinogen-III synthase